MKHLHDIDSLLERFYNGETTRDEELALRRLLDSPECDKRYMAEREMFKSLDSITMPDGLEQRLNDTIDNLERDGRKRSLRLTRWVKRSLAVASSLAVLCIVGSGLWQHEPEDELAVMSTEQVEQQTMKAIGLIARAHNAAFSTPEEVTRNFDFDF